MGDLLLIQSKAHLDAPSEMISQQIVCYNAVTYYIKFSFTV